MAQQDMKFAEPPVGPDGKPLAPPDGKQPPKPPVGKDGKPLPPPDGTRPPEPPKDKDGRPLPPPDGKEPPENPQGRPLKQEGMPGKVPEDAIGKPVNV